MDLQALFQIHSEGNYKLVSENENNPTIFNLKSKSLSQNPNDQVVVLQFTCSRVSELFKETNNLIAALSVWQIEYILIFIQVFQAFLSVKLTS